jgi:hypothetical protein
MMHDEGRGLCGCVVCLRVLIPSCDKGLVVAVIGF